MPGYRSSHRFWVEYAEQWCIVRCWEPKNSGRANQGLSNRSRFGSAELFPADSAEKNGADCSLILILFCGYQRVFSGNLRENLEYPGEFFRQKKSLPAQRTFAMNKNILDRLAVETGIPDLVQILAGRLSVSDLGSLLLAVFSRKTAQTSPAELLRSYRQNRFVQPATVEAIAFTELCLEWLKAAQIAGFQPLQLSPVCPLGTCSVVATAHQDKILTALRGTEVVADATNVLALESTDRRQKQGYPPTPLHFSAVHRHVRAQEVPKAPGFSAHFGVLCLTSAGRDTGSFDFETENLRRHIGFYKDVFEKKFNFAPVKIRLKALDAADGENRLFHTVSSFLEKNEPDWPLEVIKSKQSEQEYYRRLQFKVVIPVSGGREIEIADGGFTDWTQRLSGNRKERLLISGMGLELLYKLRNGLI